MTTLTQDYSAPMPKANANKIRMHYETTGSGDEPYLTILGGLGDSSRNWGMVARELGKDCTVVVPDLRGSGQTEKVEPPYSIDLFAQDIVAFWDRVGIAKTHLMGFSMGSMVAQYIASHYPQYVDRLILISATAGKKRFAPQNPEVPKIMYGYEFSAEHFAKTYQILFSPKFRQGFEQNMFTKFKLSDPNPQPQKYFLAQYEAIKDFDSAPFLQNIAQPTLIIAGKNDEMIASDAAAFLQDNIKNSSMILYEDCGHIPQMEQPQRFYKDVRDFFKSGVIHG